MKVKDLALASIFAALYAVLVIFLEVMSFQLVQVRLADALIPLSIVFGWPAVIGVTIGCVVSNVVSPMPSVIIDIALGSVANFIASLLAWKIGRGKRVRITVNIVAIVAVALAFISFSLPWWSFEASILGESVVDFNVYPGWFGGKLGIFITAISSIAEEIGSEVLNQVFSSLKSTAYLIGCGSFIALIGAFIRGKRGKAMIILGSISNIFGVLNFYYAWSHLLASNGVSVAGSHSITWGMELAQASWGWTYGIYLGVLACVLLVLAIVIPPIGLEANDFLGCTAATIAITFFVGTYLAIITEMELWIWWLGIGLGSLVSVNVLGYILIQVMKKLKF